MPRVLPGHGACQALNKYGLMYRMKLLEIIPFSTMGNSVLYKNCVTDLNKAFGDLNEVGRNFIFIQNITYTLDDGSYTQEVLLLILASSECNCKVGKIYLWMFTFSVLKDSFISRLIPL